MKRKLKQVLILVLSCVLLSSSVIQTYAVDDSIGSVHEHDDGITVGVDHAQNQVTEYNENIKNDTNEQTKVFVSQASSFRAIIPKVLVLDGKTGLSHYLVDVVGNIAGNEAINIIPDNLVTLSQRGKENIVASIYQDKINWTYDQFDIKANGQINATLTAGNWVGAFNFNIYTGDAANIKVFATTETGTNLNAVAKNIDGETKTTLLSSMVEQGFIEELGQVDEIILVETNPFENTAITEFDVSQIAKQDECISVYHYEEPTQTWEQIGISPVSEDNKVSFVFNSFSPVAFVIGCVAESANNHVAPTCLLDGKENDQICVSCNKVLVYGETIPALGHNPINANNGQAVTCTTVGKTTDLVCSRCNETLTLGESLAALGHSYGPITYTWSSDKLSCTATRTCSICGNIESETKSSIVEITTNETCTTIGTKTYTSDFANSVFETQITTSSIGALGHSYGTITYTWSADKSTCTASRTCLICGDVESETKISSNAITTNATCTTTGTKTYTSDFVNSVFETQITTSSISALGHTIVKGGTLDIHEKCSVCEITLNTNHEFVETIKTQATCTKKGITTYTCFCGYTYDNENINALGHSYGAITYTWNADKSTCTASRTCLRCNVVDVETKTSTNAITTAATCTTAGVRTYTSDFVNSIFETQTTTSSISALGHKPTIGGTASVHTKCSVCNATISSTHTYTPIVAIEPNCTTNGTTRYICSCGYSYSEQNIQALGHDYVDGFCTRCGVENSSRKDNVLTLSSTFSNIEHESIMTFEITQNEANTPLTIESSDETIVDYTLVNNIVEITPLKEGTVTLTITSEANNEYRQSSITHYIDVTHDYGLDGYCTRCGSFNVNYLAAGLYDENYVLKMSWDDLINSGTLTNTNGVLRSQDYSPGVGLTRENHSSDTLDGILVIEDEVTTLGINCFASCHKLKGVVFPASLNKIETTAFYGITDMVLSTIIVKSGNTVFKTVDGVLYNMDMSILYKYPSAKEDVSFSVPKSVKIIYNSAFAGNKSITNVILEEGLQKIEPNAFESCVKLININFPNTLTHVGSFAFSGPSLTSIILPESMLSLADGAFSTFKGTEFYIPKNVSYIVNPIPYAPNLTKLEVDPNNPYYCSENNVVYNKSKTTLVAVGATTNNLNFTIPSTVKIVKTSAFRSSKFKSVIFQEGITSIENAAFWTCSGLTSLVLPKSLLSIGVQTFGKCTNATIYVPKTVTTINDNAFYNVKQVYYNGTLPSKPTGTINWGAKLLSPYVEN